MAQKLFRPKRKSVNKLSQQQLSLRILQPHFFYCFKYKAWWYQGTLFTMPLYDFKCQCGYHGEHIAKIDQQLTCPGCGEIMQRLMPFTHGINMGVGAYGYFDENLDCYIGTNRQRREEMKRQGVSEKIGKGWY